MSKWLWKRLEEGSAFPTLGSEGEPSWVVPQGFLLLPELGSQQC